MTCPRCDDRGTKDYAAFAMDPCDNPDCRFGLINMLTGRPVEPWALHFLIKRDTGLRERVARAISIPQHHTSWDILSDVEKDLFYMQADYAIRALASCDAHPKGGDAKQASCASMGSAVPQADAQKQKP